MYLFVSQPMNGRNEKAVLKERDDLKKYASIKLCEVDVRVLPTYFKDEECEDVGALTMLGKAISMMHDADAVVFAKNWEHSRGCVIEHECAVRYGKKIIYA